MSSLPIKLVYSAYRISEFFLHISKVFLCVASRRRAEVTVTMLNFVSVTGGWLWPSYIYDLQASLVYYYVIPHHTWVYIIHQLRIFIIMYANYELLVYVYYSNGAV